LITLHRNNEFLAGMEEIGLGLNPGGDVTGLQSSKGVYIGRTIVGYTWFVGPLSQPSPVHFGDAMQEIERFLWDELDRQSGDPLNLPFLVGDEQGAIMALAMAAAVPDLLSGVIAINAAFPVVPGWEPPLAPLRNLPVLLVNSAGGDELTRRIESWGGAVTAITDSSAMPIEKIRAWFEVQPVRTRPRDN
jgi:hypothetical protein